MSSQTRRDFLKHTTAAAAATITAGCITPPPAARLANRGPLIVSTWGFGKPANELALNVLQDGGSALDAVEQGVRHVESSGNTSVGLSGLPNAAGVVQLDACIMNGPGHQAGSVAGVEGVLHPISAARLVMEKTPHVMLVGPGAYWFAKQNGLEVRDGQADEASYRAWLPKQKKPAPGQGDKPENHDTIALLILDAAGNIAAGCSTSGWGGKVPGRVGDSPIIGAGTYADNRTAGISCTGHGEYFIRHAVAHDISARIAYKKESLAKAARDVVQTVLKQAGGSGGIIGLDAQGNVVMEFNTNAMTRGSIGPDGILKTAIFK